MNVRTIAISAVTVAALAGTGGIAYASTSNHPTPTPTPTVTTPAPTPSVTPSPVPLPFGCYRARDIETLVATGHRPVREVINAIVCNTRIGPVVYVDTNPDAFLRPVR